MGPNSGRSLRGRNGTRGSDGRTWTAPDESPAARGRAGRSPIADFCLLAADCESDASPRSKDTPFRYSRIRGATDAQTYTVTSSNPDISATIATGPFWNVGVSYTDPTNSANDFTGTLTFQLFRASRPIRSAKSPT